MFGNGLVDGILLYGGDDSIERSVADNRGEKCVCQLARTATPEDGQNEHNLAEAVTLVALTSQMFDERFRG